MLGEYQKNMVSEVFKERCEVIFYIFVILFAITGWIPFIVGGIPTWVLVIYGIFYGFDCLYLIYGCIILIFLKLAGF